MNKVQLIGRITREPQIFRGEDGNATTARYTLAVERRTHHDADADQQTADYINCVAFGKTADFADHYLCRGIKIAVSGRLQSGSYAGKDGQKVYTTDVVVEEQEFVESKEVNEKHLSKSWADSELKGKNSDKEETGTTADDAMPFVRATASARKGKEG